MVSLINAGLLSVDSRLTLWMLPAGWDKEEARSGQPPLSQAMVLHNPST